MPWLVSWGNHHVPWDNNSLFLRLISHISLYPHTLRAHRPFLIMYAFSCNPHLFICVPSSSRSCWQLNSYQNTLGNSCLGSASNCSRSFLLVFCLYLYCLLFLLNTNSLMILINFRLPYSVLHCWKSWWVSSLLYVIFVDCPHIRL